MGTRLTVGMTVVVFFKVGSRSERSKTSDGFKLSGKKT